MSDGSRTIIDGMYDDHLALIETLRKYNEISLASDADNHLKKVLLLAAASYFEAEVQACVTEFAHRASRGNAALAALVKAKAVSRQYHSYFQWEGKNANAFFGLFGEDFSNACKQDVRQDNDLEVAVKAFLELGRTRNAMTHENIATFAMDKTADEVYQLYNAGLVFVRYVQQRLQKVSELI